MLHHICLDSSLEGSDLYNSINTSYVSLFREWTDDGQLWVQYVASTPATRLDIINLQEKLD